MSVVVKNLTKVYGNQKAVNEVNFEAGPGKILGFLGPNGAGKSTTMKMLTGYLQPTSGSAFICGKSILDDPLEAKRQVGYLAEHTPLYQDMYVREFLSFVAQTYGLKSIDAKVKHVIERVGLTVEQHKKIATLSKGYKQRVGLAQAIIHDPEVLILDEPTSGLDPNQLVDIRNLILELGKDKTVILSTHIMQEVEAICEEVVVIDQGCIVAKDTLKNLKNTYSNNSLEHIFRQLTNHTND